MFKVFKKKAEEFPPFDAADYKGIAILSDTIEDKQYSESLKIALACFSANGIFIFLLAKDTEDLEQEVAKFKNHFGLYSEGIVIFVRCESEDFYYESGAFHEVDDLFSGFLNLYENTQLPVITTMRLGWEKPCHFMQDMPETDDFYPGEAGTHKARVDEKTLNRIYAAIDGYKYSTGREKTKVVDGITYIKHPVNSRIFGYTYSEQYFPEADESAERFLLLTLLGGIFGFHKFKTKEYLKGLFYLFTCGGFGVFYVLDVISIATGTYFINQVDYEEEGRELRKRQVRIYLPGLKKRLHAVLSVFAAMLIAVLALKYAFIPTLVNISTCLEKAGSAYVQESMERRGDGEIPAFTEEDVNGFLNAIPFHD